MSAHLLISSPLLRSVLLWLAHHPYAALSAVTVLGALHMVGWTPAGWAVNAAGVLTLALAVAGFMASRLHTELDDAGITCRWCDVVAAPEDGLEGAP
ncbi:hypothetical protein [Streptomyces sp. UH6]|uniref:hypothetical protein n=1 Tax=Streptomyces sp. UH6 TaxID=2748379 RepID=UPI0015D5160A|nr:hypothetical protein [Streptomyces sp. UH6]NYV74393.1 hypothetical protein [Streptomyces sp. UH6]